VGMDDVFPSPLRLGPGRHTLKLQFRHPDASFLEAYRQTRICLDSPLPDRVTLTVSSSRWQDRAVAPSRLRPGQFSSCYIHPPEASRLPDGLLPGDQLWGKLHLGTESADGAASEVPGGYPLRWIAAGIAESVPKVQTDSAETRAAKLEDVELREAWVALLQATRHDAREANSAIRHAARKILERIDREDVARQLGRRADTDDPASVARRQQCELQRDAFLDALYYQARTYLPATPGQPGGDQSAAATAAEESDTAEEETRHEWDELAASLRELRRWVDVDAGRYRKLVIHEAQRQRRWGRALKLTRQGLRESPADVQLRAQQQELLKQLGWTWTGK
jgi:hypothetical protein